MPITVKDRELMKQVADYFEGTRKADDPNSKYRPKREDSRSLNDTANHFNITRSKVMKMLITMGVYSTPLSDRAIQLRKKGRSLREIAEALDVSIATVSSNLPYEDEIHGSDNAGEHAMAMREYRAYERMQKERQVHLKQEKKEGNDNPDMKKEKDTNEDWRKTLDTRLSFTETDSRRKRITNEMVKNSGMLERFREEFEESGIEMPQIKDRREELRNKLKEQGSLTMDETLELGEFPGALYDRNPEDLFRLYGQNLPFEPREMIRLHLELIAEFDEREKEVLHQYGAMEGNTISRDILVSDDLPLYALHYVIQRAFGFQNSHLHRFYLPEKTKEKLTISVEQWMDQVGVIYRSPCMDEYAEFWADDYERGSFKNWLRKKYTGPCVSQCREEGLISSRMSMEDVDLDSEFYVEYGYYKMSRDKTVMPLRCRPAIRWDGVKLAPPEADPYIREHSVELMKMRDLPVSLLKWVFDRSPFDLLERLPLSEVLALRNMHCTDAFQDGDYISTYEEMLEEGMDEEVEEILHRGIESPMIQPYVYSFTDELIYQYDFGDNWEIRITGSRNCADLVENGKISRDMLDKSNIKARVTYRPVLLARDGDMLIEDVGGVHGFAEFIHDVNTMRRGERDANGMNKTELMRWAKSQGWHRDNSTDFNLL